VQGTRWFRAIAPSAMYGVVVALGAHFGLKFGLALLLGLTHQPSTGGLGLAVSTLVSLIAAGTGGYLAAQGTGGSGSKAALVFGLVYLTIVTALVVFGHRDSEWWWYIAPLTIIVPAAFLGGRLAMRAGVTSAST